MKSTILFLCTGNYYRSRFAELLFNHWATARKLDWVATSRGLATELGVNNVGPISAHAAAGLRERTIQIEAEPRFPQQVTETDLHTANLVIALDRTEHAPYVKEWLPGWVERIHYWEVPDLHLLTAAEALARIETEVLALLDNLPGQR